MSETRNLLTVSGVTVQFGALRAVDDVSLSVSKGELIGVIGPNGAGKTTLLSVLSGRIRPRAGDVTYQGKVVTGLATHRLCRRGIARTHQIPRPFGQLTVRENMSLGALFGTREDVDIDEILSMISLHEVSDHMAQELRPSELRRLELGRALATRPTLLLLDEIAAGMPSEEVPPLADCLLKISKGGVTIMMVEHVMDLLLRVADRLIVLDRGRKIADGEPAEVTRRQEVITAYFGPEVIDAKH
jgi:ABC-type branched-subunit amino acid transport system ATPase component